MRIPSNLHDDPLYGRDPRRGSGKSDGIRKLIRLGAALALVVVVMRQAGRPEVYEPFFATGGGELVAEEGVSEVRDPKDRDPRRGDQDGDGDPDGTERNGVPEPDGALKPDGAPETADRQPGNGQQFAISEAFRTVADGSPWRGGDHDAFYLLLELARNETTGSGGDATGDANGVSNGLSNGDAGPLVGVLPLLQQPDVYRGKRVRVRGSVARVVPRQSDSRPREADGGPDDRYWELWLRPHDRTERPMMVIVPSVPRSIEELVGTTLIDDGPVVSVDGRFLKRLAYRSTSGAEVAPVVIGRLNLASRVAGGPAGSDTTAGTGADDDAPWSTAQLVTLVVASVIFGVGLAGFLMWRTARDGARLRRLRRTVRLPSVLLGLITGLGIAFATETPFGAGSLRAESAIDLLSGFDASRIRGILRPEGDGAVPQDTQSPADSTESASSNESASLNESVVDAATGARVAVDELAKLLFRIRRLDPETLASRLPSDPDAASRQTASKQTGSEQPGDLVRFSGQVVRGLPIAVPETLREFLELDRIDRYVIADGEGTESPVYLPGLTRPAAVGDRLEGVGVSLGSTRAGATGSTPAIAAGSARWEPATFPDVGWKLLASSRFDLGELSGLARRSRRPLTEADSEAFYGMLAAAKRVASRATTAPPVPAPSRVDPVALLRDPDDHVGKWIRMRVETVRVTRVSLAEDPGRREQLGQGHYFQIDAIGDLGDVEVRIDGAAGGSGTAEGTEPIRFRNRYPVTVVTPELPRFLANEMARGSDRDAIVASVSVPVDVDGFFFRLWSYESDFMTRRGGEQFGPMVVAARWSDRRSGDPDPAGVARIGLWAAIAVIAALLTVVAWSVVTGRRDARVREARRRREDERVELPPGST